MKKLYLSIVTLLLIISVFAQDVDRKRPASVGISFFVSDFVAGTQIKNNGLAHAIRNNNLFNTSNFNAGFGVSYLKGLRNQIDFVGNLGGSFVDYPVPNKTATGNESFLLEATASLNLKLLPDNYWVVPYVDLGLGISRFSSYYAAMVPIGFGLQLNLSEEFFISLNSQYKVPITENGTSYLNHSLTFYSVLGKKK